MRMFDTGSQAPCRCCSLRSPLQRRSPRADLAAATFPSRGITTSWCPLTRDIGSSARGGLVRRHVGERYTSTGPPAARWPEPPRPHHRPRQGRRGRWSPRPRLDIRDWSCQGRRAHNPACAGVAEAAGAPPVLGYRDGHEHRARGARNPGRYPHPRPEEGRRRRRGRVARERVRHHPDW